MVRIRVRRQDQGQAGEDQGREAGSGSGGRGIDRTGVGAITLYYYLYKEGEERSDGKYHSGDRVGDTCWTECVFQGPIYTTHLEICGCKF